MENNDKQMRFSFLTNASKPVQLLKNMAKNIRMMCAPNITAGTSPVKRVMMDLSDG